MATYQETLTDALTIVERWNSANGQLLIDRPSLTSVFTGDRAKVLQHTLTPISTFSYGVNRVLTLTDQLSPSQVFTPIISSHQFVGTVTPTISPVNGFFMYYPWTSTNPPQVILPCPDLNDMESYGSIRVNRYTRNNTLILYGNEFWGNEWLFHYKFSGLTKAEHDHVAQFLHNSLGQPILILDHLQIGRIGTVLDGGPTRVADKPRQHSFEIRFQQIFEYIPE